MTGTSSNLVLAQFPDGFYDDCQQSDDPSCLSMSNCFDSSSFDENSAANQLACSLLVPPSSPSGLISQGTYPLDMPLDTIPEDAMPGIASQPTKLFELDGIAAMINDGCYLFNYVGSTDETDVFYSTQSSYESEQGSKDSSSTSFGLGFGPVQFSAGYSKTTESTSTKAGKNSYASANKDRVGYVGSIVNTCITDKTKFFNYISATYLDDWNDVNAGADAAALQSDPKFQSLVSSGMMFPTLHYFAVGTSYQMTFHSSESSADSTSTTTKAHNAGMKLAYDGSTADASNEMTNAANDAYNQTCSESTVTVRQRTFGLTTDSDSCKPSAINGDGWEDNMVGCMDYYRSQNLKDLRTAYSVRSFVDISAYMPSGSEPSATFKEALNEYLYHCDSQRAGLNGEFYCYTADGTMDANRSFLNCNKDNTQGADGTRKSTYPGTDIYAYAAVSQKPTSFGPDPQDTADAVIGKMCAATPVLGVKLSEGFHPLGDHNIGGASSTDRCVDLPHGNDVQQCSDYCASLAGCQGFWYYDNGRCCAKSSWANDFTREIADGAFYALPQSMPAETGCYTILGQDSSWGCESKTTYEACMAVDPWTDTMYKNTGFTNVGLSSRCAWSSSIGDSALTTDSLNAWDSLEYVQKPN
ncbi:MAG: hypothetical protein SGILL_006131 [Bacillariaceae sp.]